VSIMMRKRGVNMNWKRRYETDNTIKAIGVSGRYKGKRFEIDIGQTGHNTEIYVDGIRMDNVQSAIITIGVDRVTTVELKVAAL